MIGKDLRASKCPTGFLHIWSMLSSKPCTSAAVMVNPGALGN